MNNRGLETPVLLIIFNRSESTKLVFEQIRRVRPKKLYVAADGPRDDHPDDLKRCAEARRVVEGIDWQCQLERNFSDKNLGCGIRPYSGISWVLEQEESTIILEDDCVPATSFFWYCEELLEKYRNDTRITGLSGNNYYEERRRNNDSYFYSQYGGSWGWATWRRYWKSFDYDMKHWPAFRDGGHMRDVFRTKEEVDVFTGLFDHVYLQHESVWDAQSAFAQWSTGGLTIIPARNLVSNVGHIGTHSSEKGRFHNRAADEGFRVLKHPDFVLANRWYDEYFFRNHFPQARPSSRIRRELRALAPEWLKKARRSLLNAH